MTAFLSSAPASIQILFGPELRADRERRLEFSFARGGTPPTRYGVPLGGCAAILAAFAVTKLKTRACSFLDIGYIRGLVYRKAGHLLYLMSQISEKAFNFPGPCSNRCAIALPPNLRK